MNQEVKLNEAIAAIKSGDKKTGGSILSQLLKENPKNERAWLWLYKCVDTPEKKRYCLKKAIEINPNNQKAKEVLEKLLAKDELYTGSIIIEETKQKEEQVVEKQKTSSSIDKVINYIFGNKLILIGIPTILVFSILCGFISLILNNTSTPSNMLPTATKKRLVIPLSTPTAQKSIPTASFTSTSEKQIFDGPARRYVPVTTDSMPSNFESGDIEEYSIKEDGDFYKISFTPLEGNGTVLLDEPDLYFVSYVGENLENARKLSISLLEIPSKFLTDTITRIIMLPLLISLPASPKIFVFRIPWKSTTSSNFFDL